MVTIRFRSAWQPPRPEVRCTPSVWKSDQDSPPRQSCTGNASALVTRGMRCFDRTSPSPASP